MAVQTAGKKGCVKTAQQDDCNGFGTHKMYFMEK